MQVEDIFQLLTEEDRARLFEEAQRQTLRRGEVLFRKGDVQPNLYVMRRGQVRVEREHEGKPIAVARYGPGDVVGEISYLENRPALGVVVAEEDVEVDVLAGDRIDRLLNSDSGFAARFYHSLALCLAGRLLQIMPGIKPHEAFNVAGARPHRSRTGQLSERQFPTKLTEQMGAFRSALPALAADLDKGLNSAQAQARINLACDTVIAALDQFTRDDVLVEIGMDDPLTFRDVADLARGVGGYVFRETFAAFMQSATIAQGFERPRGHAEGRDFLEKVEQAEPDGDGRFGPLIDRWFLGRPLCQARRNSVRRIMALLQQAAAAAPGQGPARLTSLSAGTCQEVLTLLTSPSRPLYLTCIDADADDLTAAADSAGQQNCADHITFLEADLLDMIDGVGPISLGPQHVIYGLGVCDYLTDDQVKTLLDWAHGLLVAGGWVIVTNREAASPDRAFVEHILDWPVIHRTRDEFMNLFSQSKFRGLPVEMAPEESGVNLIARCRKSG